MRLCFLFLILGIFASQICFADSCNRALDELIKSVTEAQKASDSFFAGDIVKQAKWQLVSVAKMVAEVACEAKGVAKANGIEHED